MARTRFSRRAFMAGATALPVARAIGGELEQSSRSATGMIIREKDPENLEYPFSSLDGFMTPNERFYVRSHFKVPTIDTQTWRLKIEGHVDRQAELTYDDLRAMPKRTLPATLECAGNGRVFLTPTVRGAQWELGAVSTAEWTGVSLANVLQRAGVRPGAVDVVLEGADSGMLRDEPKPPDAIHFARSIPIARAQQADVLLAYQMNGQDLAPPHGFPLRAVVPGWYGVASIKWLNRVIVTDHAFHGYYQTIDYAYWDRRDGLPVRVPITEQFVKSQISRPDVHEIIKAGSNYRIHGAAWTGDGEITRVEFSADSGQSWAAAKLLGKAIPHAWQLWETNWLVPNRVGRYTLMSRATDSHGRTQPVQRDLDRANYLINHLLPIEVEVR